jgi:hypothetical protein
VLAQPFAPRGGEVKREERQYHRHGAVNYPDKGHRGSARERGQAFEGHEPAKTLAVHEAVCAGRWRQVNARLGRIEAVLAAIVLLLLLGEGSVVEVLRRKLAYGRGDRAVGLKAQPERSIPGTVSGTSNATRSQL